MIAGGWTRLDAATANVLASIMSAPDMTLEALSRAKSLPGVKLEIPGFVPSPEEPEGVRPYQTPAIVYGLSARRIEIADQMGVGKTLEAAAIVAIANAFPLLVVSPAFGRREWAKRISKFFPAWTWQIIDTMDTPIEDRMVTIISYSLLGARTPATPCNCPHPVEWHNKKTGACGYEDSEGRCSCAASTPRKSIYLPWLLERKFASVIFDEAHRVKTLKAQRTKIAKAIAAGASIRLLLTGTPVPNRPVELIPQLEILGQLEAFGGQWTFRNRYCNPWGFGKKVGCSFCAKPGADGLLYADGRGGKAANPATGYCRVCKGTGAGLGFFDFKGAVNLEELNRRLRATCFVRRLKSEVQADLPPKTTTLVPLDIDNRPAYHAAESDVIAWLSKSMGETAAFRASKAEKIRRIEVLKQLAVQGKMRQVGDWIENFLEGGEKLVVFSIHRETAAAIAARFACPMIIGGVSMDKREKLVEQFQTDPAMKLLVLNIEAGGEVIELYAAHDVAFVEEPWVPKDIEQAEDRVHRKGVRDAVTVWHLLAADTVEEWIYEEVLPLKAAIAAGAVDGATDVQEAIFERFLERRRRSSG